MKSFINNFSGGWIQKRQVSEKNEKENSRNVLANESEAKVSEKEHGEIISRFASRYNVRTKKNSKNNGWINVS